MILLFIIFLSSCFTFRKIKLCLLGHILLVGVLIRISSLIFWDFNPFLLREIKGVILKGQNSGLFCNGSFIPKLIFAYLISSIRICALKTSAIAYLAVYTCPYSTYFLIGFKKMASEAPVSSQIRHKSPSYLSSSFLSTSNVSSRGDSPGSTSLMFSLSFRKCTFNECLFAIHVEDDIYL